MDLLTPSPHIWSPVDQTLIQEILEIVGQAAIASASLSGKGLKDEADALAVDAMRKRMGQIQMQGRIVLGEGERDEAPMLYIGEEVGSGIGPCLLYTSPSPRDLSTSRMPSSA